MGWIRNNWRMARELQDLPPHVQEVARQFDVAYTQRIAVEAARGNSAQYTGDAQTGVQPVGGKQRDNSVQI